MGQMAYVKQRYDVADYLSWMYYYEFGIESQRPNQIVSFDTILFPFDNYIWAFSLFLTTVTFILLVIFQFAWSMASGEENPREWLFQGIFHRKLFLKSHKYFCSQTLLSQRLS